MKNKQSREDERHEQLVQTIKMGDNYAFRKKYMYEELAGLVLWLILLFFEYKENSFGWVWKIGIFFIVAIAAMWVLRFTWWFLYHVLYPITRER